MYNLETSNDLTWSNIHNLWANVYNVESNIYNLWANVSNLELSNIYLWDNVHLKANIIDPVFSNNITVEGNVFINSSVISLGNALSIPQSNQYGTVINRPTGNNIFQGYLETSNEYTIGITKNTSTESNIQVLDDTGFVMNVHGNVHGNYFIGDGSFLTGVAGASNLQQVTELGNVTSNTVQFSNAETGLISIGDVIIYGNTTSQNIQLTNPNIVVYQTANVITIDGANKTYGTTPLLPLNANVDTISYSNLINGAQVIVPLVATGGPRDVSNVLTGVDYQIPTLFTTITQDNHALMTLSNLSGNVYINVSIFSKSP